MKWLSLSVLVLIGLASFWFIQNSRAATETPDYEVLVKDGKVEIRSYPDLKLATTVTRGSEKNGSFMTLFRFIDGGNESKQKISMTSPVLMEEGSDQTSMSFIVPRATVDAGVPEPSSEKVSLTEIDSSRFVVMRFSRKGRQAQDETKALAALREWIGERDLAVTGSPLFAYYDPPWTPFFMRRNEVMLKLTEDVDLDGLAAVD